MSEIIPDVQDIVAAYLAEHGYDGLCDGEYGCACDMTCLMCCEELWDDCTAGTKSDCKTCVHNGSCTMQSDGETDWMMFPGHEVCGGYEQVVSGDEYPYGRNSQRQRGADAEPVVPE